MPRRSAPPNPPRPRFGLLLRGVADRSAAGRGASSAPSIPGRGLVGPTAGRAATNPATCPGLPHVVLGGRWRVRARASHGHWLPAGCDPMWYPTRIPYASVQTTTAEEPVPARGI